MYLTLASWASLQRHLAINVLQPGGSFDLSHCVHPPQAPGSPPPSDLLLPAWSMFERKRREEGKSSLTLWPLSRPWAGSGVEPSTPHEAPLHGALLLCYFNSLVTVLNPRGSLKGTWGSQAWLLTAPRWKASDAALSPPCHLLPWLSKLLWDFSLLLGVPCWRLLQVFVNHSLILYFIVKLAWTVAFYVNI